MHSFLCILIYIVILLTIGMLKNTLLCLFFLCIIFLALYLQKKLFLKRLIKLKWLFLSIFLVCAFSTPGEYLSGDLIQYLPTKEGVVFGLEQVAKVMIAIAGLSVLFYKKDVQSLIQGLYLILLPLKCLNLNVNQFSMRLLLTLNYVNEITATSNKSPRLSEVYQVIHTLPNHDELKLVQISITPFSMVDYLILGFVFLYLSLMFTYFS